MKGELTDAVGYGETGQGALPSSRMQRSGIKVDAVGPTSYIYRAQDGTSLPVSVPPGEIATGESTCFGDSGGPLFDAQGNVVGATSRGIDDSCVDRPSIFSDTRSHEASGSRGVPRAGAGAGCSAAPDASSKQHASDVLAMGLVLAAAVGLGARRRRERATAR